MIYMWDHCRRWDGLVEDKENIKESRVLREGELIENKNMLLVGCFVKSSISSTNKLL